MQAETKARWEYARSVYEGSAVRLLLIAWGLCAAALVILNPGYYVVTALLCAAGGVAFLAFYQWIKACRAGQPIEYPATYGDRKPPAWTEKHDA